MSSPAPLPANDSALLASLAGQYADAVASLPDAGPGWLAERRRDALRAALAQGLPGAREERWKYTSLRALERRRFAIAHPQAPGADGGRGAGRDPSARDDRGLHRSHSELEGMADGPRLVFANGHFDAVRSTLDALPAGVECEPLSQALSRPGADALLRRLFATPPEGQPADAFLRLNAALARDGVVLRVAPGALVDTPLQLLFTGTAAPEAVHWALRNLVELGEGASLTLIERWLDAGEQAHLGNAVTSIELGRGARLCHLRLQQGAPTASSIASTRVQVGAGAAYCPVALELGASLARHAWDVELAGAGASTTLRGVVLAAGRQQLDTRYSVTHAVADTRSDTLWRAIAGGRARSAFHGGIHIAAGADGSDAALETKNLLLTEGAEIDAQPVLVIEADEVKASHGATVGQLDPTALFYLQSRGLPEREARHLLVQAFCAAVLDRACACSGGNAGEGPWPALHAAIRARLAGIGEAT
jgi:Fe-S cluster assembly protein SufD